jgi:4-diphosphocytidyl-2-C-methyl-D-erythritol kinase
MNEIFDRPLVAEDLQHLAASLGSDVPFFLHDGAAWCRGRGEILEDAAALPGRTLLLIKPPFPVPTVWAYKRYADMKASEAGMSSQESQWLGDIEITNDLEAPVFGKYLLLPVMKEWLCQQPGVESAFMTGSGSTMVAVLKQGTSHPALTELEGEIRAEFGDTIWISVTGWE